MIINYNTLVYILNLYNEYLFNLVNKIIILKGLWHLGSSLPGAQVRTYPEV